MLRLRARAAPAWPEPRARRQWLAQLAFACRLAHVTLGGGGPRARHPVVGGRSARSPFEACAEGLGRSAPTLLAQLLADHAPADSIAATALVDSLLPVMLGRALWSRALVHHAAVLVQLAATNALLPVLSRLRGAATGRGAAANEPHGPSGVDAVAARLVATELHRRLPGTQVLVRLRAGTRGGGDGTGGSRADGKVSHLLEARILEALRFHAQSFPAAAVAVAAHTERLLHGGAQALSPIGRFQALVLLRDGASQTTRGALHAKLWCAPCTTPPPLATDLAALLFLAISPQPAALRAPLWRHLAEQLSRCSPESIRP